MCNLNTKQVRARLKPGLARGTTANSWIALPLQETILMTHNRIKINPFPSSKDSNHHGFYFNHKTSKLNTPNSIPAKYSFNAPLNTKPGSKLRQVETTYEGNTEEAINTILAAIPPDIHKEA